MISPADSAQDAARGDDMTETMQKKLILIDGHSIINRAFYGMPDLTNSKGVHTGAVYGFLNILFRILDEEKADYLIVAFDEHAPTFRHEMYAAYKGTRKPMPEELRTQVPLLRRVLTAMGVEQISRAGIEADDILGTCAKKAEREGMTVSLVSGDRDLLQVATDKICVRIPKTVRGQTTIENYHPADVSERYQITPRQVIEIKGRAMVLSTASMPIWTKSRENLCAKIWKTIGIRPIYRSIWPQSGRISIFRSTGKRRRSAISTRGRPMRSSRS